ncbi:DUF4212 domain-containing protein [Natrarchaeobaculum sulfurireducens]|uniref:Sodium symporter small subunit domain-containing protein n=1 Tax=Natrarchaeobaculum sulfurireducens TaxID=2044521 RepID=A0A346PQ23_9EURY|nr:DUF4212 domain-containing protein [Natrarchaeobaculum sulfurireducens]AXR78353.1 hypothetical protein AArc1_2035 [Natrarchaeobaculum sulfurireducens]AXR81618.1 hypothetical protein AArcMg_1606 [Natrarchaeobaculum sulfurireducens]
MSDNTNQNSTDVAETDGGVKTEAYLDKEINLFKPATPFMRDNLRAMWGLFALWAIIVFGPTTAILFAPEFMTGTEVLGGFPLHFFITAVVTPLGALVLSAVYAFQRDRLDTKYGISHEDEEDAETGAVAADGGEQ